jgi:rhodanese-related sulfurtransferase
MGEAHRGQSGSTVERLLAEARARLHRLSPARAQAAARRGAVLIDIRSEVQRERDGVIPGSRFIARNVLEWRCDPASPWRDAAVTEAQAQVIVICNEGYQSSLAAATLQQLGVNRATDVIGGFQAWKAAGLPVQPPGTPANFPRDQARTRRVTSGNKPRDPAAINAPASGVVIDE